MFIENDNLCLYGYADGKWEVTLPTEMIPIRTPEPILGISFIRDQIDEKDWLEYVALHSDVWLFSLAFTFGSMKGFDKDDRYLYYILSIFCTFDYACICRL